VAEYCLRDVRATVLLYHLWKDRLAGSSECGVRSAEAEVPQGERVLVFFAVKEESKFFRPPRESRF